MFVCIAGKNNIAVCVLEQVIKRNIDVENIGVVCNQNETGKNGWQKSLRFWAKKYGIREYRLEDLYEKQNLIFLSMEFDKLIKPSKFLDARLYNVHFSLLPAYKGMYTSAIPILNGEKAVGVTFHEIDSGIDTGDIIKQKAFTMNEKYTCRDLYLKYIDEGIRLVTECLDDVLNNRISAEKQPIKGSSYYSKKYIDYENLHIDLKQAADMIDKQIRAYSFREYQMPEVYGKKIIASQILEIKSKQTAGTIIMEDETSMMLATVDYNIVLYFDRFEELLCACECGDLDKVRSICEVREHINCANTNGWTPLIVATYNNRIDIVKYLIMHGANIFCKNSNGTTLLMYAKEAFLREHDNTLFKMFLDLGLDILEKDYNGNSLKDYVSNDVLSMMIGI